MNQKQEIKITCKGADLLPFDSLENFQGNLKKITKQNLDKLKKRIIRDGINVPLFVWRENDWCRILDGHQRLKALQSLREDGYIIPMIPVCYIEAEDEKDARQKLLGITSQFGELEIEELSNWMSELDADVADTIRLSEGELKIKTEKIEIQESDIPSISDELKEKWKTESGQLWILGDHKILCGDSGIKENVEKIMLGEKASCIFTDPPYGVSIGKKNEFLNSFQKAGSNLKTIESDEEKPDDLKKILVPIFSLARNIAAGEDCTYFVTAPQGGELGMMMMMMMIDSGLPIRHVLMWYKNAPTFSMGRLDYDYQHEPILMTWTKKHKKPMRGEHRTSVWKIDKPRSSAEHPTMKPVELYVNAYLNNSDKGDIVYEPFSGSGTAILAAEQTGRKARAIEIDPAYVAVALERWSQLTNKTPELVC